MIVDIRYKLIPLWPLWLWIELVDSYQDHLNIDFVRDELIQLTGHRMIYISIRDILWLAITAGPRNVLDEQVVQ